MVVFKTYLSVLESSVSTYATSYAFRIPRFDTASDRVKEWNTITFQQFKEDVELLSRYWTRELKANGITRGDVVGLW